MHHRNRSVGQHARPLCAGFLAAALLLAPLALPATAAATGALGTLPTIPTPAGATAPTITTITPSPSGPVTVPEPASTSTSSGGISRGDEIVIFVIGALVIAGIARLIMTDARRHTPAGEAPSIDRPKGTVAPIEHRLKRSRARAKRARRARRAGR